MRYFDRIIHPEWTDLAVMVGPTVKWVENDYEDLSHAYPEVFLGYRVVLAIPETIDRQFRGVRVSKLVVCNTYYQGRQYYQIRDAAEYLQAIFGTKLESWYVHRGIGIHKVD